MEDRERKLQALDAALERGMTDVKAGRVKAADAVFDRLEAKYAGLADKRGEL